MHHSIYDKVSKHKRPRVHIKYELETEHGVEEKELPFVIGAIGDFAAESTQLPPLKEREFIKIDQNNFDEVMRKLNPTLQLSLQNVLLNDDSHMSVKLCFNNIKDFEPDQLIQKIEPLRKLKQARDRLRALLNTCECSDNLEQLLAEILTDQHELLLLQQKLASELQETTHE